MDMMMMMMMMMMMIYVQVAHLEIVEALVFVAVSYVAKC